MKMRILTRLKAMRFCKANIYYVSTDIIRRNDVTKSLLRIGHMTIVITEIRVYDEPTLPITVRLTNRHYQ
jgi:hypothetical protein